jgi:hypothetical protein
VVIKLDTLYVIGFKALHGQKSISWGRQWESELCVMNASGGIPKKGQMGSHKKHKRL